MKILNLGCGTKTSSSSEVVNMDWSIYLRVKRNPVVRQLAPLLLRGERLHRFRSLPQNIVVHDLSKGIPFPSNSIDVVFHSHLLEHLDRDVAPIFQREIHRVLKPGGIQRIVMPDLEFEVMKYVEHLQVCEQSPDEVSNHDSYIAEFLEQSVRREPSGTSQQRPLRRFVENLILGDARKRGETHQWMYDRFNMANLLMSLGFAQPIFLDACTSQIPNWKEYGLDRLPGDEGYRDGWLYVEATKLAQN
jgi:SAM-dependent methyltransferase